MKIRPRLLVGSLLVAVAVIGIVVWVQQPTGDDDSTIDATLTDPGAVVTFPNDGLGNDDVQGDQFPDVVLLDRDDDDVTTADLLGEPLVVNLWYCTCPPCAQELPDFAEVDAETDDVRFIGVNTLDSIEVMERFAGERGVEYDLFHDEFVESHRRHRCHRTADHAVRHLRRHDRRADRPARCRPTARQGRRPARCRRRRRMSLSFIRGMVAAVNPVRVHPVADLPDVLPRLQGTMPGTQRATMRRAVIVSERCRPVSCRCSLVAGIISYNFTNWINENAKYATGGIGVALLVLGVAMLFGYKLPFMTPRLDTGGEGPKQTVGAMFVYGIAYAVASIGCTIGLFIATVFSTTRNDGLAAGVGNMLAYGAGMALLVSALTIALASANTGLLKILRGSLQYVDRIAAVFVTLSGLYLLWYFYWVDIREEGDPITDWAQERQVQATVFLTDHWQVVGIVMAAIVGGAMIYAWSRPNAAIDAADAPVDETSSTGTA